MLFGNQIKQDEEDGTTNTHVEKGNAFKDFAEKSKRNISPRGRRPR
jgi:hypothetical protein